ncbi:MAG: hypothetical protein GQ542_00340, partial [Desulforhopalus sp.]|nr:hypothetical protein [Desulforhopalus sp.]
AATINHTDTTDQIQSSGNPRCDVALSKNVSFIYVPDTTTASSAQTYGIGARHFSGNKCYGTASDTTLIFWTAMTTGDVSASEIGAANSSFNTGWTSM